MEKFIYKTPDNKINTIACDWNEGDNLLDNNNFKDIDKYVRFGLEEELCNITRSILDVPVEYGLKLTSGSDIGIFITLLYLGKSQYNNFKMRRNDYAQVRAFSELSFVNINIVKDEEIFDNLIEKSVIYISNPGNPNCKYYKDDELVSIVNNKKECYFIIDLAYIEFSSKFDLRKFENCNNVVFFRTFSKYWGIAGARLGAVIFSKSNILSSLYETLNSKNITRQNVELIKNIYKEKSNIINKRNCEMIKLKKIRNYIDSEFKVKTTIAGNFITIDCIDENEKNRILTFFDNYSITIRDISHLPDFKNSVRFSYREKAFEKIFF